jgi:ParB family chromosome partitioning protein
LQPLLVRPKPGAPGQYQIIAGERRWRAAQKISLHEVPVLVRDLSDTDAMAAGLVENLQREDLNPVEEAEGYQRLITEFRLTQDQLAEAIGKSRAHIGHLLRIKKLPDKVLALVKSGELSFGHAKALTAHSNPIMGANAVVAKGLTVRQTEEMVNQLGRSFPEKILSKPRPVRVDADTQALAAALAERLGMRVSVTFDGTGGTVMLNYKTLDQLDEILRLLNR